MKLQELLESHLNITSIVLFSHLWCKRYSQSLILQDFNFGKQTITDWFRFCRDLCVDRFVSMTHTSIGYPGTIFEIDESLIAKIKYNSGRILHQLWMFGAIERREDGDRRCFIAAIPKLYRPRPI
ncbi:hypothetical protein RF11_12258 [Thelohanellus kitauei]|uniref:ISXO2-like transposase domain-containing protein n=1 Tax=Thelohanellus kitauei TaxID=669202 RepID=A0A0C2N0D0_THEKT|nr:hypothetical protein RF11_12258 [Thelohanellus kitauei]